MWLHHGWRTHPLWFQFFKSAEGCSLAQDVQTVLVGTWWALEKNGYSTIVRGVFYKCWLDPVGWWGCWVLYLMLCLVVLSIAERRVLRSPTTIVDLSLSPLISIDFCFTSFAALFGTYTFRIAVSSFWINSYYFIMSLSIPDNFLCLKVSLR